MFRQVASEYVLLHASFVQARQPLFKRFFFVAQKIIGCHYAASFQLKAGLLANAAACRQG